MCFNTEIFEQFYFLILITYITNTWNNLLTLKWNRNTCDNIRISISLNLINKARIFFIIFKYSYNSRKEQQCIINDRQGNSYIIQHVVRKYKVEWKFNAINKERIISVIINYNIKSQIQARNKDSKAIFSLLYISIL